MNMCKTQKMGLLENQEICRLEDYLSFPQQWAKGGYYSNPCSAHIAQIYAVTQCIYPFGGKKM